MNEIEDMWAFASVAEEAAESMRSRRMNSATSFSSAFTEYPTSLSPLFPFLVCSQAGSGGISKTGFERLSGLGHRLGLMLQDDSTFSSVEEELSDFGRKS